MCKRWRADNRQSEKPSPDDTGYRGIHNFPLYIRLAARVGGLFALVYFGMNWITDQRTDNFRLYFTWELAIPFVPAMITVYASIVVLLLLPPFSLKKQQLHALARAMVVTILVAAVVYLVLPADLGFQRPAEVPGFDLVFQALYAVELPHNLVPSLHIACSTLFIAAFLHNSASYWIKIGLFLWGVLICISVLLVHQHHVLDVLSGLVLGLITYRFLYLPATP